MVTVIKEAPLKKITCPHCQSLLEYDSVQDSFCDDIRFDEKKKASIYHWYIRCPKCWFKVLVEKRNTSKTKNTD